MRLAAHDTADGIADLYTSACARSRDVVARIASLDEPAAVPSFGRRRVDLPLILVHMIDETTRHAGHLDLLLDAARTHSSRG